MTASKACVNRLQKEYKTLLKEPSPQIKAHPNPHNILEWHYVIEGHKGSDFEGGVYHDLRSKAEACTLEDLIVSAGKLLFQPQYPFKAPGIMMLTPNGRFTTGSRLCLSMSDFHPETWNPLWSVGTILTGLMSFMYDDVLTTGAIRTSSAERRRLASQSLESNLRDPTFKKLFPEYIEEFEQRKKAQTLASRGTAQQAGGSAARPKRERSWSSIFLLASVLAVTASIIVIPLTGS